VDLLLDVRDAVLEKRGLVRLQPLIQLALLYLVQELGFGMAGVGVRVSGFACRVSGFGVRVSHSGFRVLWCGFQIPGFGFRVSGTDQGVAHALERARNDLVLHAGRPPLLDGPGVLGSGFRV